MTIDDNLNPYERLANAIIIQACEDYRNYPKQLKKLQESEPKNGDAKAKARYEKKLEQVKADIREVVSFFYSDWHSQLTTVNPEYLLERLNKECEGE